MAAVSMAQSFKPLWGVLENKEVILQGNWAIGATGAVGAKVGGTGLVLTRTGTGLYSVQIVGSKGVSARVHDILYADVRVRIGAGTDFIGAAIKAATASTGVITFATFGVVSTTVAIADPPNPSIIDFVVVAKLSSAVR